MRWSSLSRTRRKFPGCCPASLPRTGASKCRWSPLCDSAMASWPTSTSTGTRHPSSSKLGSSRIPRSRSSAPKLPAKSSTPRLIPKLLAAKIAPEENSHFKVLREIASGLFTRNVQIPEQALLARQDVHTGQEALQAGEVGAAFRGRQFLFCFLPRIVPTLRNPGGAVRRVGYANLAKPRSLDEPFIFSRRAVNVITDGAARGDFFVRKHSANDQGVAKEHSSAWLEHTIHFTQHFDPAWDVAQDVIGEHRVKYAVVERQLLRDVTF